MSTRAEIVCGDGIAGMRALPPGCAGLVLNDPPWAQTSAPWDRALDWRAWWAAIDHVLAPTGTAVVFASLKLALTITPIAPRPLRYDLVWRKNKATGHLDAKKRPMRRHELILVFGEAAYEPQFTHGHEPMHAATRRSVSEVYGRETTTCTAAGRTDRYATSVLDFDVVDNCADIRIHSTQKPIPLLRWLVRAYSQPGELVVDPTCGSGSAIQAARAERRAAIGWEIDPAKAERAQRWLDGRDLPLFDPPRESPASQLGFGEVAS